MSRYGDTSAVGRRANGEGSIFLRSDGRWAGFITLPSLSGEQRKKWVTGKTQEVTRLKLEQVKDAYGHAPRTSEATIPFREYAEMWLRHQRAHIKPRTYADYAGLLKNHVVPHLGKLQLGDVGPQHVRAMQHSVMVDAGPVAARQARGRARTILQQAFEDGLIPRNPAQVVKPVKAPPRKYDVWSEAEVDTFLQVSKGHPFYALFYLGLSTGLRPGELLALEWCDIGETEVRVRQTITQPQGGMVLGPPKSPASVRSVPLPADARELLICAKNNSRFIFPSLTGGLMSPRNLHQRSWVPLLHDNSMRYVRPYVMRHTFATFNIAEGIDPATLAKWMGHTDSSFTLKQYAHFFERKVPLMPRSLAR